MPLLNVNIFFYIMKKIGIDQQIMNYFGRQFSVSTAKQLKELYQKYLATDNQQALVQPLRKSIVELEGNVLRIRGKIQKKQLEEQARLNSLRQQVTQTGLITVPEQAPPLQEVSISSFQMSENAWQRPSEMPSDEFRRGQSRSRSRSREKLARQTGTNKQDKSECKRPPGLVLQFSKPLSEDKDIQQQPLSNQHAESNKQEIAGTNNPKDQKPLRQLRTRQREFSAVLDRVANPFLQQMNEINEKNFQMQGWMRKMIEKLKKEYDQRQARLNSLCQQSTQTEVIVASSDAVFLLAAQSRNAQEWVSERRSRSRSRERSRQKQPRHAGFAEQKPRFDRRRSSS